MAAVVDLTSGTQEEDGNGVVEIITAENSEHPSAVALGNDAAVPNRLDKRPYDAQVLVVEDDPSDQSPSSVTRYRRNRRRARAPSDTEVVCVAGPTSSPGEVVFVSAEPRKTSSKSLLSCHLCGDSHPEECTVSCSKGRRRQRHTLCCDCLENYVSSQAENMGQAFAQHRGNMPCSGLGTGCDEVFPRERVVELLRPPTRAKFLKGLEAGGRILERQCYEEQLEKLRKELAEAREREGGSEEDAVVRHVNALADMQADCCPHCGCAFTDFTGCFVVSCGNTRCRGLFCGWCLTGFRRDANNAAHGHVSQCPQSLMRGTYFAPFELYVKARRARATQRALKYLKRVPEDLLAPVKKKAVFILAELGIK